MAKINILDSSIYNRIAAGEVVERPASAVKEFVENSIDAGAKNIEVRIERGGKDLISVIDDGSGIERSELRSAFLPHATSKIAKVEDLDVIQTLGFRGEALASVASVANVTLKSRAEGAEEAFMLTCSGGKMGEVLPCALECGTEIAAENLFFNTPVRAKFMKTDKGEESEVSTVIARFILGNPHIAFKYFIDGKLSVQSFGGGEEEAVAAVYGASAIGECYRLDAIKHGVRIRGYLGKPSYTKANRTYQSTFVNGRFVSNNTISSAVANAYASYLMKRQYPFYVLFIDVPPEVVDVNVHPNKSDVRFENNQVIYGSVYSVISAVLDGNASALEYVVKGGESGGMQNTVSEFILPKRDENTAVPNPDKPVEQTITPVPFPEAGKSAVPNTADYAPPTDIRAPHYSAQNEARQYVPPKSELGRGFEISFHDSVPSMSPIGSAESKPSFAGSTFTEANGKNADAEKEDVFAENKKYLELLAQKAKQQKIVFENAVYKGSLFNTYLIYEEGDNAYLIDQHAAHERLIFDRLCAEMEERKVISQPMLVPFVLSVNREESQFVADNLDNISDIGFEIEEFGEGSYKISAVPVDLQDIDLQAFFAELLGELGNLRGIRLNELLRDKIAMTACKHAIKGGMALTDSEKEKLFAMLRGDMGLKCPHGRPVAVKLTKYEIEKMFKRIV